MPLPPPEPGLVIRYVYLWDAEYAEGRDEGKNDRPCAIVLATRGDDDEIVVTVLAVTHTRPQRAGDGIELPLATKRRLGLDDAPSWVVMTEVNRFVWPGPDLRTVSSDDGRFDYGFLPTGLFRTIRDQVLANARAQRLRLVPRTQ